MQITHSGPGRTVQIDGLDYLYFSGTAYLGLSQHPDFIAHIKEGMDQFGANFGGSRRSNLQFDIFEKGEAFCCALTGAPRALLFSSGTLAGQVLQRVLREKGDIHYAPGTHPALWGTQSIPQLPYVDWVASIQRIVKNRKVPLVIFANSLDPLKSVSYSFDWLAGIPEGPPVYLAIDDSHGLGVTGENGSGIYSQLEVPPWVSLTVVASLGKAFSLPGGVVLSSQNIIDACWDSPFFGGASPMPPAYLHAFLASEGLRLVLLEKLRSSIRLFAEGIRGFNYFQQIENYPVFYTSRNDFVERLLNKQIMISSFPYPGPKDRLITRIVLSALHEKEDISYLLSMLLDGE